MYVELDSPLVWRYVLIFEQIMSRVPAKRWGQPVDLSGAIIFLASAASDYVTGSSVVSTITVIDWPRTLLIDIFITGGRWRVHGHVEGMCVARVQQELDQSRSNRLDSHLTLLPLCAYSHALPPCQT